MKRLFISHATEDTKLASQIIDLLHAGLNLPADEILCTSVDGYRLVGGAVIDDQLPRQVCAAEACIGIVSEYSLRSVYVSFELGARWGAGKSWTPLLARGMSSSVLPGPLAGINALRADRPADLHQLVDDLSTLLSLPVHGHAVVQRHCEIIAGIGPDDRIAGDRPNDSDVPPPIGALPEDGQTRFRVWAPDHNRVEVVITTGRAASSSLYPLTPGGGYFTGCVPEVVPGDRYGYRLDGSDKVFPDPASRYQPKDVHSESEVVDPSVFSWTDQEWRGIRLDDLVLYEIHVGTATTDGTFDALITSLGAIRDLGVTAIMLMAVADFAGNRNWGYEGVDLFAPARVYGGPEALRRLVDAAHARQLAVILDVVFNHLGPEGNYLAEFSKGYFSTDHRTPWGPGINYQSRQTGRPVCDFVVANACHWAVEYHVDGIRLDAIGAIRDDDEPHIVSQITGGVKKALRGSGREFLVIAEDDTNDPKLVRQGNEGFGLDAVYADDFHHQLHVALTGETSGYYADYKGTTTDLANTIDLGWSLVGHTSQWRKDDKGNWKSVGYDGAQDIPAKRFVWCIQNHDQVGNRPRPQRLNQFVSPGAYRAASALLLLAPYTPLLFMGQEWATCTPFYFFVDRDNPEGHDIATDHRNHMADLFPGVDLQDVPDPRDEQTFLDSKLRWDERKRMPHSQMLKFYKEVLRLRREHPALRNCARGSYSAVHIGTHAVAMMREGTTAGIALLLIANLKNHLTEDLSTFKTLRPPAGHVWRIKLDSECADYGGHAEARLDIGSRVDMPGAGALLLEATEIAS